MGGDDVSTFRDQCLEVVELTVLDGFRVPEVEVGESLDEPVHLGQQRDHNKELGRDMLAIRLPSSALVLLVNAADTVDEEGGFTETHQGIDNVDYGDALR